jgi:hypothetical protein
MWSADRGNPRINLTMKQFRIRKSRRIKMNSYRGMGRVKREEEIIKDLKEEIKREIKS